MRKLLLLTFSVLMLFSCTDFSGNTKEDEDESTEELPTMFFPTGIRRSTYEGETIVSELIATNSEVYEKKELVKMLGLEMLSYENGRLSMRIISDKGDVYSKKDEVHLEIVEIHVFEEVSNSSSENVKSNIKLTSKVYSSTAIVYSKDEKAVLTDVTIHSLDGTNITSKASSKKGIAYMDTKDIDLIGDVAITASNDMVLNTTKIRWNQDKNILQTDEEIFIEHPDGHWIKGKGMTADLGFDKITIFNYEDYGSGSLEGIR